MAFTILDSATRAAHTAALTALDGTREAAVVLAISTPFANLAVTETVKNAGGTTLCTITRAAWDVDTTSATKKLTGGAITGYTIAQAGTPASVTYSNASGTAIFSVGAGVGSGDVSFEAAIAVGVPPRSGTVAFTAPTTLDSEILSPGTYWSSEPPTLFLRSAPTIVDLSGYIGGSYDLMQFSRNISGVDVRPDSIYVSSSAAYGTYELIVGPDDFGYQLAPDDTDGVDVVGGASNLIGGTSTKYIQSATRTEWATANGTWRNENYVDQATTTASNASITDINAAQTVTIDVLWMVQRWAQRLRDNFGVVLIVGTAGRTVSIGTIQTGQPATLTIVSTAGTATKTVAVDAILSASSNSPTGASLNALAVSPTNYGLLWFDLLPGDVDGTITSATLTLTSTDVFGGSGAVTLNAFMASRPWKFDGVLPTSTGKTLAWNNGAYAGSDSSVIFGTQFPGAAPNQPNPAWLSRFYNPSYFGWARAQTITPADTQYGIALPATSQYGLRMYTPPGANIFLGDEVYAFNGTYPLANAASGWIGLDRVFVHFRVVFGTDHIWSDAGKLVGVWSKLDQIGARTTAGVAPFTAGNTGNVADNTGWSARGNLTTTTHGGKMALNPARATGYYCYHIDQLETFGDHFLTGNHPAGLLVAGRPYDIDMEFRINTPGVKDGILRTWVDDALCFERLDIQFRPATVSPTILDPVIPGSRCNLNITGVCISYEYGGRSTVPPGEGGHIAITDFVISTQRIGRQL